VEELADSNWLMKKRIMSSRPTDRAKLSKRLLTALFLGASAFLLAHSVNAVVENALVHSVYQAKTEDVVVATEPDFRASQRNSHQRVQDILSSGLFPVPSTPKAITAHGSVTVPTGPPLDVAKKVALVGTVMGVTGNERAILEDLSNKKQGLYQMSQRIPDVGELVAIEKNRVLFRQGSQEEWLELAIVKQEAAMVPLPRQYQPTVEGIQQPPMSVTPAVRRVLDRAQLVQFVSNPAAYLTEARFQPHFTGAGKHVGFRVDGIREVGVLEKVGLRNEDVLAGINGVEIRDPGRLWDVFKQLQNERSVRFNVVRQSQPLTLIVEIR
jgi:general secretion pathway protein C